MFWAGKARVGSAVVRLKRSDVLRTCACFWVQDLREGGRDVEWADRYEAAGKGASAAQHKTTLTVTAIARIPLWQRPGCEVMTCCRDEGEGAAAEVTWVDQGEV